MARIVTKPFILNSSIGEKKPFAVGDIVEGDEAEHWYVQAHSDEIVEEAKPETAAQKKAREKAEKAAADAVASTEEAKPETAETAPADEAKE
ncbi:MAG: hypothetical protein ABFC42_09285 [Sulfuricella sp.]